MIYILFQYGIFHAHILPGIFSITVILKSALYTLYTLYFVAKMWLEATTPSHFLPTFFSNVLYFSLPKLFYWALINFMTYIISL